MSLTPAQCRAARALLGWSQQDLERTSRVAKKTIADFERGARSPFPRTLDDLVEALEKAGVEFTNPVENTHGSGVRFKWGLEEERQRSLPSNDDASSKSNKGFSTSPWDDDFEDFATDQPVAPYFIPISDADRAILRQHFSDPERWKKLSDRAKAVYRRELGLNDTVSQINNQNA